MAREPTGWERAAAVAAAGLATLVAVPVVVVGVLFVGVSSVALDGCEDLGSGGVAPTPTEAGVSARSDGATVVHLGPCGRGTGFASVRLDAADGTTVWLADATSGSPAATPGFDTLVVGRAPPGFADVVPLAAPLDPTATYTVRLARITSTTASSAAPLDQVGATIAGLAYDADGQSATFRPADLDPATVTYGGERLTPAAFADRTCDPQDAG